MQFKSIGKEETTKKKIWIKEGEAVGGVFRGEIHEFGIHWVEKNKKLCIGKDKGCEYCRNEIKTSFQFRVNFIYKGQETYEAAIYENDWFAYQRLHKLNEQFPLEKNVVKIYKGTENGYKVDLFERVKELSPDVEKIIESIPLIETTDSQPQHAPNGDIPF